MNWTDDKKEIAKAFAIAPAIPVAIVSVFSLPAGLFVFMFGAPVAYACAALVGIPLFALFNKANISGWSYFVLGGSLCAVPGILLFTKFRVPLVYSLQSISGFSLIGAAGGFIFWWLYPRKKFKDRQQTNLPGFALIVALGGALSYVYVLGQYDYIDGKALSIKHPFVSPMDTNVTIEADGQTVEARLPKGVPYRTNCKISVVVWRELFNHKKAYSLSHYPDYPQAHHYQWLTEKAQKGVSKSCS
ncbi:hypothetical protein JEU11_19030 [Paraglaciecola chathamensis]|uniref:Uncharacterized protein n=1 Tax=Paraglaciecola chathamensis TaxID=368405 RepID=A0ABS0WJA0_9ALTE|nr:hypothetical protein [Paraglaciecola chathamensis]MBJ2138554.1 hypothetical protein [Paraglaciecola chathamensis]